MAWKQVVVQVGKTKLEAMSNGEYLENLPLSDVELGESIKVDGKDIKILSSVLTKDGLINIKLAGASPKIVKEKSEDDANKQAKG